jgi:DNA-binding transcriptional LysR family regulator
VRHLLPYLYLLEIAKAGSIRKAADVLAITHSALNRRLLSIEQELDVQLFERLPSGVRPSTAGEIFLQHIRSQVSDMARVKSRIADLSGMRSGNVSLLLSEDAQGPFWPEQIKNYQTKFPMVTFEIRTSTRADAEVALKNHSVDLAFLFEPRSFADFHVAHAVKQPLQASVSNSHPLASQPKVRLYECAEYPLILPPVESSVRRFVSAAALKSGINLKASITSNNPATFQHCLSDDQHISIQLPINHSGTEHEDCHRSIDLEPRDVATGFLFAGYLKGRTLPVASALFLEQIVAELALQFD